ncbi:MAG: ABC transporter permease [Acidobacteriota bacterium]|nr:ABC transporter permease [Acidobacteriota bacterium]
MVRLVNALLTLVLAICATTPAEPAATPEILASRQLVERRGWSVGDVVRLSADPNGGESREFRLVGVFEPTPDPMKLAQKRYEVRLHLPDLLAMTRGANDPSRAEPIDALVVALKDPSGSASFARDVSTRFPGVAAEPSAPSLADAGPFVVLERFHLAISLVTVLGSTAFLLALMVMRAEERRETAGILRLLGLTRGRILRGVLVEGLLVAVAGALFGVLFAYVTQGIFNAFFQWHYDTALVFVRVTPGIALRCVAVAIPLGVLAGIVASWTLLRREIPALIGR